jgi:hypothetical protein
MPIYECDNCGRKVRDRRSLKKARCPVCMRYSKMKLLGTVVKMRNGGYY